MKQHQPPNNSEEQLYTQQQSLGNVQIQILQIQGHTKDRGLSWVIGASGGDQKEEEPRKTMTDEPVDESGGTRKHIVIEAQ